MPLDQAPGYVLPDLDFDERVRQGLRDAADYIERHGWCQGALENAGRVCLVGALRHTMTDNTESEIAYRIRQTLDTYNFAAWNDTPGRTQAEVVQALRKAAEL